MVLPQSPPPGSFRPDRSLLVIVVVLAVIAGISGIAVALHHHHNGYDVPSLVAVPPPVPLPVAPPAVTGRSRVTHAVRTATRAADRTAAGTVVDSAMATRVVNRYWAVHEQSLVDRNLPALRRLSAGPARRWEQATVACGCLAVEAARPIMDTAYFINWQTHFPASFDVEVQTEDREVPWAELLVFTKRAAGRPWLVTQDSGFGPPAGTAPHLGGPDLGADGYDQPVEATESTVARHVAARFAAVWQQAKDTGTVPRRTGFDLTGQPGERVASLAAHRQDAIQASGVVGHFRFFVSRTDPVVQVSDHGNDLTCQPIHEVVHYWALPGQAIRQDAGRREWGPSLAPGDYQRLTTTDVWQTCFLVPPDPRTAIEVFDQDVGGMRATAPRHQSATTL